MFYREFPPSGAVATYVKCYWTMESTAGPVQRIVPDGCPELILNFGDAYETPQNGDWRPQPRCFLAGQLDGPMLIRSAGHASVLGVRFTPQGAARVFALPMHETVGRVSGAAELSPALARDLEPVWDAPTWKSRIERLDAALSLRPRRSDPLVDGAVAEIVRTHGTWDVRPLAAYLGLSPRQFERRFRQHVGLTPKLFARIRRFQHVFHVIEEHRPNWVQAAVQCGYYDQSHLIRDFQDFAGEAPSLLLHDAGLARHFLQSPRMSHFSNTPLRRLG